MLINGRESEQISASDRGFQYGDGLFETLLVENGEPEFLDRHLERLRIGCERLSIRFPGNSILKHETFRICESVESAVLKIIVSRGPGGRGYRIPDPIEPTRVMSIHGLPEYPIDFPNQGIRAVLCKNRLGINPALAGLKHMNRLEQILARSEWDSPSIQEGLMRDSSGNVIEGTMSNLFLVQHGALVTPDLSGSGVFGIVRAQVLEIAARARIDARIEAVRVEDIEQADEIFVTNSIIGLWPVVEFERSAHAIGPVTRKIMQCLDEQKKTARRK